MTRRRALLRVMAAELTLVTCLSGVGLVVVDALRGSGSELGRDTLAEHFEPPWTRCDVVPQGRWFRGC